MVSPLGFVKVNLYLFVFFQSLLLHFLVCIAASRLVLLMRGLPVTLILRRIVLRFDMVGGRWSQAFLEFRLGEEGQLDDCHKVLDLLLEYWETFHMLFQLIEPIFKES